MVAGGLFSVAHTAGAGGKEAAPYVTAPVSRGDVRAFVSATGVLQAWKVADVKSDVSGRIDKLAVDLGDHVRAGQLIALIDPTDTRTAAVQARADLDAAVAKRAQAVTDEDRERATARAHIAGAERAVQEARAKALQAKATMEAQPALTRASIGAQRKDILYQFLIESVTLSLSGGVIGILLGVGPSLWAAIPSGIGLGFPMQLTVPPMVISFVFSALVGVFFGIYPAMKASALDPIVALRYE